MITILPLSSLTKEMLFPVISITCRLWKAMYHQKYFMLQSVLTFDVFLDLINMMKCYCTKMKFPVKDFFSKYDQIRSFLLIWPHLLKKSLMENFIFYVVPIHMLLILMKEQGCECTRIISLLKKNFEKKL